MKWFCVCLMLLGCAGTPVSNSGVKKAEAVVETGSDGLTEEQRNIKRRLEMDNTPGGIQHLYIISPFNGRVIKYFTVKGKVSSSGKRLSPTTTSGKIYKAVDGETYTTPELIGDDGAYGSSEPYLFWFGVDGSYHQHFLLGGQTIHISSQPETFIETAE